MPIAPFADFRRYFEEGVVKGCSADLHSDVDSSKRTLLRGGGRLVGEGDFLKSTLHFREKIWSVIPNIGLVLCGDSRETQ